ncbi:MAG: hypothetical protein HQ538_00050 [Parcubacteria group bacterium]|nr:hypothetical protein [Parcubacteria group bacterium]
MRNRISNILDGAATREYIKNIRGIRLIEKVFNIFMTPDPKASPLDVKATDLIFDHMKNRAFEGEGIYERSIEIELDKFKNTE